MRIFFFFWVVVVLIRSFDFLSENIDFVLDLLKKVKFSFEIDNLSLLMSKKMVNLCLLVILFASVCIVEKLTEFCSSLVCVFHEN